MVEIDILQIPDQYWFVFDRDRYDAIEDGLALLSDPTIHTPERREELRETLEPAVGYRIARQLYKEDIGEIAKRLDKKKTEQKAMRAYLDERVEAKLRELSPKFPPDFGEQEVRRDAVFYPLACGGVMAIGEALGQKQDWEEAAREIARGQSLDAYLRSEAISDILNLLPSAVMFNKYRHELRSRLQRYGVGDAQLQRIENKLPTPIDLRAYHIPEERQSAVEQLLETCVKAEADFTTEFSRLVNQLQLSQNEAKALERRIKKVVRGSSFTLARAVQGLRLGQVDEKVLVSRYRTPSLYPLAAEIAELGLKENAIDHVHTSRVRYRHAILNNYSSGINGMPTKLINYLGITKASKWGGTGSIHLLDPTRHSSAETLGLYIGHFFFGSGIELKNSKLAYSPKNKGRDWFEHLLARIGELERDPSFERKSSKEIAKRFGKESRYDRIVETYLVPAQFIVLAKYALETSRTNPDPQLSRSALQGWLRDRYFHDLRKKGGSARLKPEYEADIRHMAQQMGLGISEGLYQ